MWKLPLWSQTKEREKKCQSGDLETTNPLLGFNQLSSHSEIQNH